MSCIIFLIGVMNICYLLKAKEQFDMSEKTAVILEPEDVAKAVVFSVSQPEHCAVNEILVEPREAPA